MTLAQRTTTTNRPSKGQACRCIRCGREIKRDSTQTILGVVGPECEQYVMAALNELSRNGLGDLVVHGEIRLPAVRKTEDTWGASAETAEWYALARRVGLMLSMRFDTATKEIVLTLTEASKQALLRRSQKGVAA